MTIEHYRKALLHITHLKATCAVCSHMWLPMDMEELKRIPHSVHEGDSIYAMVRCLVYLEFGSHCGLVTKSTDTDFQMASGIPLLDATVSWVVA